MLRWTFATEWGRIEVERGPKCGEHGRAYFAKDDMGAELDAFGTFHHPYHRTEFRFIGGAPWNDGEALLEVYVPRCVGKAAPVKLAS